LSNYERLLGNHNEVEQESGNIPKQGQIKAGDKADMAYFLDDFQTDQKKDTSNWKKIL
jgi:hypothetical protein